MNFLCHALPILNDSGTLSLPLPQRVEAICTGMPDFLSVIDRKIRARKRATEPFLQSDDEVTRAVAAGIVRHLADDRWFHGGATFVRMNLEFALALRERLPGDTGFRPSFVGHILIEMLLDANYVIHSPRWAERYYALFDSVSLETIAASVNRITGKPTDRIPATLRRFANIRFLYDYADDDALLMRLNQVMSRVGLAPLTEEVKRWFPEARREVLRNHAQLLSHPEQATPYPAVSTHP